MQTQLELISLPLHNHIAVLKHAQHPPQTHVTHLFVSNAQLQAHQILNSIMALGDNKKLVGECQVNDTICSVKFKDSQTLPSNLTDEKKMALISDFLSKFRMISKQGNRIVEKGIFFYQQPQICYYQLCSLQQNKETINQLQLLQIFSIICSALFTSQSIPNYLKLIKSISSSNIKTNYEFMASSLMNKQKLEKSFPKPIVQFLMDLFNHRIANFAIAFHSLQIAIQKYRWIHSSNLTDNIQGNSMNWANMESKPLFGALSLAKTSKKKQKKNQIVKKITQQVPKRRLKQSHSMMSLTSSTSKNRKYKKMPSNHFKLTPSKFTNPNRSQFNHTSHSFWTNGHKQIRQTKKFTNAIDYAYETNKSWFQIQDLSNTMTKKDQKQNMRQSISFSKIKQNQKYEANEMVNDTVLMAKIHNSLLKNEGDKNKTGKLMRMISEEETQRNNKQIFDQRQLDFNLKKNSLKMNPTIFNININKSKKADMKLMSQVCFISEKGWHNPTRNYQQQRNMANSPTKKSIKKQLKREQVRKQEKKELKKQQMKSCSNDDIEQIEHLNFARSKQGKGTQKIAQTDNEVIKKSSTQSIRSNKSVNIDFLASVLGFLSKQLASQKPRWCICAYIVYLQYSLLRFQQTGQHHEKISKSLKVLHAYINKNKKIGAISTLLDEGASNLLDINVEDYLDKDKIKQILESIKQQCTSLLIWHFKNIGELLHTFKSEWINKKLLKPYIKYLMLLVLSISVISNPDQSIVQLEECKWYQQKIQSSNQMFMNVQQELKDLQSVMKKYHSLYIYT